MHHTERFICLGQHLEINQRQEGSKLNKEKEGKYKLQEKKNVFQKEKIITVYFAQLKIDNIVFIDLNYNTILMDSRGKVFVRWVYGMNECEQSQSLFLMERQPVENI